MSASRKKVLFVDDDVALLELLKQLMGQFAGDAWEILTASDVSQALVLLQQRKVNLLVVDVRMPLVDGVQLLGLLQRKYPYLTKVVLTAEASEEHRSACLGNGAELFLEKPRDEGGWRAVYAMLNELSRFQPDQGFTGMLRRVGLQDILQLECLARSSIVLEVRAGEKRGQIFLKEGQIIHAEVGDLDGEAAFNRLMALGGGEFEMRPWAEPPRVTISGSWEFLLMEAARARDEKMATPLEEDSGTPFETQAPTAAGHTGSTVMPVLGSLEALMADGTDPGSPFITKPAPASAGARPSSRPQIDELVICSPQGEVFHEWKCANTTSRVGLLEAIGQKARQLAQRLPLGAFDRIEVNGDTARVVAQVHQDRAVFMRVSRTPVPAVENAPAAGGGAAGATDEVAKPPASQP